MRILSFLLVSAFLFVVFSVRSLSAETLTITDAVEKALSHHPRAQAALTLSEEVRGEILRDASLPPPKLFIRWDDIPSGKAVSSFEERRIGISQSFDFPLRYNWQAQSDMFKVREAGNEAEILLLELEAEVRNAYLKAWYYNDYTSFLKTYSDTLNDYDQRIQLISQAGAFSKLDAAESRMKSLDAKLDFQAALRESNTALENLSLVTGIPVDAIELVSPLVSNPIDSTEIYTQLNSCVSPSISLAENQLERRQSEKRLAVFCWLPELELSYFSRAKFDPDDRNTWAFELESTIPLWFWSEGKGSVQYAEARLARSRAELADTKLRITIEARRLAQELINGLECHDLYRQQILPVAEGKVELARQEFRLGGSTYIELLEAWDDYRKVVKKFHEVRMELYEKRIEFDFLTGKSLSGK